MQMPVFSRLRACAVTIGAVLMSAASALAADGQPSSWALGLQEAASPVMVDISRFHNLLLVIITAITAFVLILLLIVMVRFNARANPTPSRTTHNAVIEVVWTILPVVILVAIAIPSFRLLFLELDPPKADLTVKATGKQWYWSYNYPDNGNFEFELLLVEDKDLKPGQPRLLTVDNEMVVPVEQGGARAGDRRRRDPFVRGALVRHQDRRRAGPAQRHLVQGDQRRPLPRPMLGIVRQGPRLHADHRAGGERRRIRRLGGPGEEECRA